MLMHSSVSTTLWLTNWALSTTFHTVGQTQLSLLALCATTQLSVQQRWVPSHNTITPHTLARYAEAGRFCGVTGKDDLEVFENFVKKIEELKAYIGVKETIKDYGVDEKYFLDTLDEMSEQAFDDQCTGANPRYPLVSELRELYLDAYYGREPGFYED